jgi:SAM-dependent methyltransferase
MSTLFDSMRKLKRRAAKSLKGGVHQTEIVTSLTDLDQRLDAAERARSVSDDCFRESLSRFSFRPELPHALPDPFSRNYTSFQLKLYEKLVGRPYRVENEETDFNFEHAYRWPFPYSSKSPQTVGDSLIAYGFFIRSMNLPTEATVLEMGSGYGSLSMHLALMGYDITCVDMSQNLLKFVERRAKQLNVSVKTVCGDMATVEVNQRFDAVLFHESFHHCFEHQLLISRLEDLIVPGGQVFFAAEPVVDDGSDLVPYPWGLRMDGLSLISIRRWGWMELGFQRSYFYDLLGRAGWSLDYSSLDTTFWASLYTARRFADRYRWPMRYDGAALATEIGHREGPLIVSDGIKAGFVQFGPYVNVPAGKYKANWFGRIDTRDCQTPSAGHVDATTHKGTVVLGKSGISSSERSKDTLGHAPIAGLEFSLDGPTVDLELRLFTNPGVRVHLSHLTLDWAMGSDL